MKGGLVMKKIKESDLVDPLEVILRNEYPGGQIYIEVDNAPCGGRPDVVVKDGNKIFIYELKLSCNIKLLEQCIIRKKSCNRVCAVVGKSLSNDLWIEIFKSYGIGLIVIDIKKMNESHPEYIEENFSKFIKILVKGTTNSQATKRKYYDTTLLNKWKLCLLPEMRIENGNDAGVNHGYLTQKKIYTERFLSKFRIGRYYHPTDESITKVLNNYSSNPVQMSFEIVRENIDLFNTKIEGRKKYYMIKEKFEYEL